MLKQLIAFCLGAMLMIFIFIVVLQWQKENSEVKSEKENVESVSNKLEERAQQTGYTFKQGLSFKGVQRVTKETK